MSLATPAAWKRVAAWMPQSLATRIFLVYGLTLCMASLIVLGLITYQQFDRHIEDNRTSVAKLADVSMQPITDSALIGDFDTIKRLLSQLVPRSPLRQALYIDKAGGVIDISERSEPSAPRWLAQRVGERMPMLHRSIGVGGREYGELRLFFDAEQIAGEIWSLVQRMALVVMLGLAAGLAVMRYALRRWLGNLDRLQVYEAEVLAGGLNAEAALSDDAPLEVRRTIEVINRTAGSLRAQFGQRIDFLMHSLIQHKKAMDEATIVCELDESGRVIDANESFVVALGEPREALVGRRLQDLGAGGAAAGPDAWQPSGRIWHGEVSLVGADGQPRWYRRSIVPIVDAQGHIEKFICIDIDISEQKASESQLLDQVRRQNMLTTFGQLALESDDREALMRQAVELVCDGLHVSHAALLMQRPGSAEPVVHCGTGWEPGWIGDEAVRMVGEKPQDMSLGLPPRMLQSHGLRSVLTLPADSGARHWFGLAAATAEVRRFTDADRDFLRSLAHVLTAAMERSRSRERLTYLAQFDSLTGLPNRSLLFERLEAALASAHRQGSRVCVMYLDLDRFKLVNDTLGHDAGDQLLMQAAHRMIACLRTSDTVARLSGDEFAILLPGLDGPADAEMVASKVISELRRPFDLEGRQVFVSASVGASLYPDDALDPAEVVRCADHAMYSSKSVGRNTFRFYSEQMSERESDRLEIQTLLRVALEKQEFFLVYQPKIALEDGRICGFEALLRWDHPERGPVGPAEFIPVLEDTGMIIAVGGWVLHEVAAQVCRWQAEGFEVPRVAINLSARQFTSGELEGQLQAALESTRVDPALLEFELTESMLMPDPDMAAALLARFRSYGLSLSVDDFGTAYSSLSYLRRFPLDALKVDREFVRDLAVDPDDAAITTAIINLAHSLKLRVVAEGVETSEQLAMLMQLGCDEVQGYYFSPPQRAEQCADMLREGRCLGSTALWPAGFAASRD